jgi:hypothetical protein
MWAPRAGYPPSGAQQAGNLPCKPHSYTSGNTREQAADRPHRLFSFFSFLSPGGRLRRRGNVEMSARGRLRSTRDKDKNRLFHDQVILYGPDSFDAPSDFTRFLDGMLRINEAAQLDRALEGLDADLEGLEKMIFRKQGFYLGRDNRIIHVFTRTFMVGCRCAGRKGRDEHKEDQIADKQIPCFHNVCSFL